MWAFVLLAGHKQIQKNDNVALYLLMCKQLFAIFKYLSIVLKHSTWVNYTKLHSITGYSKFLRKDFFTARDQPVLFFQGWYDTDC